MFGNAVKPEAPFHMIWDCKIVQKFYDNATGIISMMSGAYMPL